MFITYNVKNSSVSLTLCFAFTLDSNMLHASRENLNSSFLLCALCILTLFYFIKKKTETNVYFYKSVGFGDHYLLEVDMIVYVPRK